MNKDYYNVKVVDASDDYDYKHKLIVERYGEEILSALDYGAPEDNSFVRDWSWVPVALEQAYKYGYTDGYSEGEQYGYKYGFEDGEYEQSERY